ncbi:MULTISPECIES: lytic polysaccharide monooxygenase auxiliary activity family 9 protein [unclassified Streptomyces]|uniref:lytic polysaccharide monooxygenase auxiliary activity family 9 protein n=1 Tax=unclassified Streptomyces TaxID=2593676 RepID=UPI00125013F4|nr:MULTISPECIES: lytic polysaccharide monooxygenase [unclassified Streptomyces]KAB2972923.1 lytic polysaccharide monooxygenase [Streptomyces sp. SS1-1]MDI9836289.1 lytic polysaccharide monooxygenase [Streptomyces sp. KAU_LT]
MRRRTKLYAAALGLTTAGALALSTQGASGHGYTDLPVSRQKLCQNGTVANCGSIQWEPQSVEGPKGFPGGGPADGQICNGGLGQFGQLSAPRTPSGAAWPTTRVTGGQNYTFRWQFTAMHATTDFRYYVTKQGWNQDHNLSRSDLNLTPFFTVPYNGQRPPSTLSHSGRLPTGLSGHHVILAVWTIADTGNAFYACSDVTF